MFLKDLIAVLFFLAAGLTMVYFIAVFGQELFEGYNHLAEKFAYFAMMLLICIGCSFFMWSIHVRVSYILSSWFGIIPPIY